jgi:hypothetical protein
MSNEILEVKAELPEITPTVTVPIHTDAPLQPLTYEERQAIYAELAQYYDITRLPLPQEFFDNDVSSERGLMQLEHDAHMVGLLNKGMVEMSKEKEEILRKRFAHKVKLLRESTQ